ncbi:hypothetical protein ACXZ7E_05475 [Paenibacillus lautus]
MSFELLGKIRIKDDGASKAFNDVNRAAERARRATMGYKDANDALNRAQAHVTSESRSLARMLDHAKSAAIGTGRAVRSSAGMMGGAARSTAGLTRQIGALTAGYLAARGAKSLFDKTIAAAATYEMQEITVQAMFGKGNEKAVDKYLDYVQKRADISMYEIGDFLGISKGFISTSKNNKQLEQMVNLAERLAAIDPVQGLEGSGLALKEYFGGDSQSLVERFELSRKELNKWKSLPLERQLKELDKHLTSIGASNELLEAQSKTSLGEYRKAIGAINRGFREMGTEGLRKINPLLEDFNKYLSGEKFKKLKVWATDAFSGLVNGAVNMVRKATDYINRNFIDNPEFQSLAPEMKVRYIFNKLSDDFTAWYNESGRAKVEGIARSLTDTLAGALKASQPLIEAAIKLGTALGSGIIQGVLSDPLLATLLGGGAAAKLLGGGGKGGGKGGGGKGGKVAALAINPYVVGGGAALAAMGYSSSVWESVKSNPDSIYSSKVIGGGSNAPKTPNTTKITDSQVNALVGHLKGHNGGLRNVPYNGYTASLHAGEAVLTREEAKRYRNEPGANGGGKTAPTIVIQNVNLNNGMDYDEFVGRLVRDLAM